MSYDNNSLFSETNEINVDYLESKLNEKLVELYPNLLSDGISVHVVTSEHMPDKVFDSLRRVLPKYYEEVEDSLFATFRQATQLTRDSNGYFTVRKILFGIYRYEEALGITMTTFKRGGSIKFGPTAVTQEHRHVGIGTVLRDVVESILKEISDVRKFYLTVNSRNHPALLFNLERGFRVEGNMKDHYMSNSTELILSRKVYCPIPRRKAHKIFEEDKQHATKVDVWKNPEIDALKQIMQPVMKKYYATDCDIFYAHLLSSSNSEFRDYAMKSKVIFRANNGEKVTGIAVCTPKRGGSLKIAPLVASDNYTMCAMVDYISKYSRNRNIKKLYTTVPIEESYLLKWLMGMDYELEATLIEPYVTGQDFAVLAKRNQ